MDSGLFDNSYVYEDYIRKRFSDIEDLEVRKELKEVIQKTLLPLYEHMDKSYHKLWENFMAERSCHKGSYQVITGIEERKNIDMTDTGMFPMCQEDMEEREISYSELADSLAEGKAVYLYTIYIHADYRIIRELYDGSQSFTGTVKTEYGQYPAEFKLSKCNKYIGCLETLYYEFINNGLEWRTVCAPYVYKMFDVSIVSAGCPADEAVLGIEIDFGGLGPYVRFNHVPVWNIRLIELRTSVYPVFCMDRVHYMHSIVKTKLNEESDYIVSGDIPVWNVERLNGELQIRCNEKKPVKWRLKEFVHELTAGKASYPGFHNSCLLQLKPIHTAAQLKHIVKSLGYQDYIQLERIEFFVNDRRPESYSMDSFIADEIRQQDNMKKIYFIFNPVQPDNIWNRDVMSYIVSRLQILYPEYHCIGILKQE